MRGAEYPEPNVENLKCARLLEGMSRKEVAGCMGWTYGRYYHKETGQAAIRISEARQLADIFYTDVDTLFYTRHFQELWQKKQNGEEKREGPQLKVAGTL